MTQPAEAASEPTRPDEVSSSTEARERLRRIAMELTAVSESGLAYCTNHFDIDRFHLVGSLARDLMDEVSAEPLDPYDRDVASIAGYTTPKLDVRAGVFDDAGRVLLVQEVADQNRWTLPGGWCDILESPREAIEREVWEEAGLRAEVTHLAAVLDRHLWPHTPVFDKHMYKLLFVCRPLEALDEGYTSVETGGVGWFDVDDLPELSVSRVLPEQISLLHSHWADPRPAHVD